MEGSSILRTRSSSFTSSSSSIKTFIRSGGRSCHNSLIFHFSSSTLRRAPLLLRKL